MRRKFNTTGSCNPQKHFMADISAKLETTMTLIEEGEYLAICRPRQYGKTTLLDELERRLEGQGYVVFYLSFEGVGDLFFESEVRFGTRLVEMLGESVEQSHAELSAWILDQRGEVLDLKTLSRWITLLIRHLKRPAVLFIDEVDKSSNNQLFLSFLGMLRQKYLERTRGRHATFFSVVLAGVHDIKSLKLRIRDGSEVRLNSPWNIAADYNVALTFGVEEVGSLLLAFSGETGVTMDFGSVGDRLVYYTSGHPFLVSKLCKIIDEELERRTEWTSADVDDAFRWLTRPTYRTTHFDDLVKNLENNRDLYRLVLEVAFGTREGGTTFSALDPVINLGCLYGILREQHGRVTIHNRVYEQILSDYLRSRRETSADTPQLRLPGVDYAPRGELDLALVLRKFQDFLREHESCQDQDFLEREGRLLFLSFLRPIINGKGFAFKEPVVGDERRMDLVITFGTAQREVIELKVWRGPAYHQKGVQQLSDYLDHYGLKRGFMLIFDFSQSKAFREEFLTIDDKRIFVVWV